MVQVGLGLAGVSVLVLLFYTLGRRAATSAESKGYSTVTSV